ncbi:phosphotransferase [Streptosporangium sp. CA-135522]|uniref:phosphotransferase n=1 Tax=Streptosporangium sp. CA-135522 TaxID=3240072 RepID=UPI003D8D44FC
MSDRVPAELLDIADALMPGASLDTARFVQGGMHDVVLFPGVAAVRVSRRPSGAEALPRRTELLRVIAASGLPFAVPEPLTPVTMFDERAAVAVSWLDGAGLPDGVGDPARLGELLQALRELPVTAQLRAVLGTPRTYTDGHHWADILAEEVIPRLPGKWRDEGRRRLEEALTLRPVPDSLVHGDLGGENIHWSKDGKLIGVLDWDRAQLFDPAVDTAFLGWVHGWDNVREAVDGETYRRARVWDRAFGVTHLVAALDGRPLANVESYVRHIVAWLEQNADR